MVANQEAQFGNITALIGDPIRSLVLWTLLDGRAYTATELAICADTSPQNISMHLSKLVQADLLTVESQGRHRYYRFSRQEVAYAIEALANLLPQKNEVKATSADLSDVKYCRTCYDHLAGSERKYHLSGSLGAALLDKMLHADWIRRKKNSRAIVITSKGQREIYNRFKISI